MITSNALGHFVYSRSSTKSMSEKDKVVAVENANANDQQRVPPYEEEFRPNTLSGNRTCPPPI